MSCRTLLLIPAIGLALTATPAAAQSPGAGQQFCAKRPDLLRHLDANYQEAPISMGLADNGNVIEVFSAKDGATWTITVSLPNGLTCMVASGQFWETAPVVSAKGSPI